MAEFVDALDAGGFASFDGRGPSMEIPFRWTSPEKGVATFFVFQRQFFFPPTVGKSKLLAQQQQQQQQHRRHGALSTKRRRRPRGRFLDNEKPINADNVDTISTTVIELELPRRNEPKRKGGHKAMRLVKENEPMGLDGTRLETPSTLSGVGVVSVKGRCLLKRFTRARAARRWPATFSQPTST